MVDSKQQEYWWGTLMYPGAESGYTTTESYCLPGRQERVLQVPVAHLMGILSGTAKFWLPDEIPADACPLRTFQDENTHSICIVVGHPSFPLIKTGTTIPKYSIVVTYPDVVVPAVTAEPVERATDDSLDNREV